MQSFQTTFPELGQQAFPTGKPAAAALQEPTTSLERQDIVTSSPGPQVLPLPCRGDQPDLQRASLPGGTLPQECRLCRDAKPIHQRSGVHQRQCQCVCLNILHLNVLCVCSFGCLFIWTHHKCACLDIIVQLHMEKWFILDVWMYGTQRNMVQGPFVHQQDCDCFLSFSYLCSDQWILCSVMCFGIIQSWT